MDNLSYRNNRPSTRSTNESEQSTPPAPSAPQSMPVAAPVRTKHANDSKKQPKKRLGKYVVVAVGVVLIAAVAWYLFSLSSVNSAINSSKYQAVFFTNGQVYFGKLSTVNNEYMRLTNVYYLQTKSDNSKETSPQSASKQNNSDVELIKLGGEIHGPEDAMIIAKDQVLFFENLKTDGNVSQTITNYQSQHKAN